MKNLYLAVMLSAFGLSSCQYNKTQAYTTDSTEVECVNSENDNVTNPASSYNSSNEETMTIDKTELAEKKQYYFEAGRWSGGYDASHASNAKLKEEFIQKANSHDPADMGNKDLLDEYLRGYEEGQRQRNQELKPSKIPASELAEKKQYYFEAGRWSGGYDASHASNAKLKEEFIQKANSHDPADMGNKDLLDEYMRGYEEGQRQRNQL